MHKLSKQYTKLSALYLYFPINKCINLFTQFYAVMHIMLLTHWSLLTQICVSEIGHHIVKVMACHLFGAKPLPEPMPIFLLGGLQWNLNLYALSAVWFRPQRVDRGHDIKWLVVLRALGHEIIIVVINHSRQVPQQTLNNDNNTINNEINAPKRRFDAIIALLLLRYVFAGNPHIFHTNGHSQLPGCWTRSQLIT